MAFALPASKAKSTTEDNGTTARAPVPAGAIAVIHGHIDSGPDASDGMVDNPTPDHPYGDSQPLKGGMPNATASHGQIGWHEIVNGKLQFTFPGGALTQGQAKEMQDNLNDEQRLFQN